MTRTADVVVIGGGANGPSTAFHLALLGVRNEPESRLAFESLKVFRNFGEIAGGECGVDGVGFVQLEGRPWHDADHDGGQSLTISR